MDANDLVRFATEMTTLYEIYDRKPSKVITDAYFEALADLSIEEVERAFKAAIAEPGRAFMPKPGELRQLIEGSGEDQSQKAWQLFLEANRVAGHYVSLWVEDAALARAIHDTFGGWVMATEAMHSLSDEMIASKRKEFFANYRIAKRRPAREAERYLQGMFEVQNRANVATWNRARYPNGTYNQKVGIVGDERVDLIDALFSVYTGQLTEESKHMLEGAYYIPVLEQMRERKALPSIPRRQLYAVPDSSNEPEMDLQTAIKQADGEEKERLSTLAKRLNKR